MGLTDRFAQRRARRALRAGLPTDPETAAALHRDLVRSAPRALTGAELDARFAAARTEVGPALAAADAARNERDVRLALVDDAVARAAQDPDGVTDVGLRELGARVADLGVPDALNRDAPYERIGVARARIGLPPHALREVPRLRPVGNETPLLVERMTMRRGPEALGRPGDELVVEVTTHRLALRGATDVAVPLQHLMGIDIQPSEGRPVLVEHTNGSPLLLESAVGGLLVRVLRDARLARVRRTDRAATAPFPTSSGGTAAPSSMPMGSAGFSYAGPGFAQTGQPAGSPSDEPRAAPGPASTSRASAQSPWGEDADRDGAVWDAAPRSSTDHGGLYALLGVTPLASDDEVKRAFRRTAQRTHPDRVGQDADVDAAEEAFKRVAHAYRVLSDPGSRAAYDAGTPQPF